jgi:hypothetical protein
LPFWDGPYKVVHKVSDVNYRVQSLDETKLLLVHVQRLLRYRPWSRPALEEAGGLFGSRHVSPLEVGSARGTQRGLQPMRRNAIGHSGRRTVDASAPV